MDHWLSFKLDGVSLIVSKIPVRYRVMFDDIYNAGLVYGTNNTGVAPCTRTS